MENPVNTWFKLPVETKQNIFNSISLQEGLPVQSVEKDWWVCFVLRAAFSLSFSGSLAFKGGTSLSKAWKIIERFSEDIDLVLDRKALGFEGQLTNRQIKNLRKVARAFMINDFTPALKQHLFSGEWKLEGVSIEVQENVSSSADPSIIKVLYPSVFEQNTYIRPQVLLEIGVRSLTEPIEKRNIQSLVNQAYKEQPFWEAPFIVPSVLPKRTFLEKAFLLHEEFSKPTETIRHERLSRHLYDLRRLAQTTHATDALADKELYNAIVKHRERYTHIKDVDYSTHQPSTINFIPPESVLTKWQNDYQEMQKNMIYGESPAFNELINDLQALIARFRTVQ